MMNTGVDTTDDAIDEEITKCLDPCAPRSFFLYAGAGSGKTRSLVNVLTAFRNVYGKNFRKSGRKIAIITYTNAACDEITSRLDDDPLFNVSTIHSFCWSQIGSFHADIQGWLKSVIPGEITDLIEKQSKGRSGSKAADDRARAIISKTKQLEWLSVPRRFTYNPNGDNFGMAALSHSDVLKIAAHFIITKPTMQSILVNRFPFLLIDESQDTSKYLMDAFFELEEKHSDKFALGLFGDMMQRIYADGKPDLGHNIPARWLKPVKRMNHRSPQRIVQLGNKLRSIVDGQYQAARSDSKLGIVRLFIVSAATSNKQDIERQAREKMSEITTDTSWTDVGPSVKVLTLEHHMAASRMGFGALFGALDRDSRLTTGLKDGSLAGVRLFSERILPLLTASAEGNKFAVMSLLRQTSPLLSRNALQNSQESNDPLVEVRRAVNALLQIDVSNPATTFLDILKCVHEHGLFDIPDSLKPFVETNDSADAKTSAPEQEDESADASPSSLQAWRNFLETPYYQIIPYAEYIADIGSFATHQGVKGQEFDRVLVIMDDTEARGFSFSYDKLLGATHVSTEDQKRRNQGEETGIDRTRRLFYVTCTRVKESLALIAYTQSPDQLSSAVIQQGWFEPSEIMQL